jgi:hypothetical protein
VGPLGQGQRWTAARKWEVVLHIFRGEPLESLSAGVGRVGLVQNEVRTSELLMDIYILFPRIFLGLRAIFTAGFTAGF